MKEMRKDRRADQIAGSGQTASPCWISRPFPQMEGTNVLIFHLLLCQFASPCSRHLKPIESTNDYSSMIFSLSESSYFEVWESSQISQNNILVALGRASYIFHIGQPKFISFQYRKRKRSPTLNIWKFANILLSITL